MCCIMLPRDEGHDKGAKDAVWIIVVFCKCAKEALHHALSKGNVEWAAITDSSRVLY